MAIKVVNASNFKLKLRVEMLMKNLLSNRRKISKIISVAIRYIFWAVEMRIRIIHHCLYNYVSEFCKFSTHAFGVVSSKDIHEMRNVTKRPKPGPKKLKRKVV